MTPSTLPGAPPSPPSAEQLVDPFLGIGSDAGVASDRAVTAPGDARRQRLLVIIAVGSMLTTLAALGLAGWGLYHFRHVFWTPPAADASGDDGSTKPTGLPPDDAEPAEPSGPVSDNVIKETPPAVPDDTKVALHGRIEVVEIGLSASQLRAALLAQSELARAKGQVMLMMTTGRDCGPCRGVDAALDDPLVQQALAGVRLVRVDLRVFKEELAELQMPTNLYPAFFLLGPDMVPKDGIHGGEWDEDIPKNIAPVLGAFARGQYKKRRHDWSPTTGGIAL